MARKKQISREEQIKQLLIDAKIYDDKLMPQIELVARLESLISKMSDEMFQHPLLMEEIRGKEQDTHYIVNPILPYLITLEKNLQTAYASIGLNYNLNPNNINAPEKDGKDGLDGLFELG